MSVSVVLKFYTVCFYCILIWGLSKRGLEMFSLPHFLHDFWRKIYLLLHSINWPSFIVWLHLIWQILSNMCIVIVCYPGYDVMNFKINLFNQAVFSTWPKCQGKNLIILRKKELLRWNKHHFSPFLEGYHWNK